MSRRRKKHIEWDRWNDYDVIDHLPTKLDHPIFGAWYLQYFCGGRYGDQRWHYAANVFMSFEKAVEWWTGRNELTSFVNLPDVPHRFITHSKDEADIFVLCDIL